MSHYIIFLSVKYINFDQNKMNKAIPEFKVILIGDSGVGKTSCILRATQDTFDNDGTNTIGFSF
jgi:GTPase SAR1 family protein